MKIDDLLSQAGSKPLSSFGWAAGVVELINSELTVDRKITEASTGTEANAIIRTLSSAALLRLLTLRFDATGNLLEEEDEEPPHHTPAPAPAPAPAPKPKLSLMQKVTIARAALPLFVGIVITLMGLMLAATMSFTAVKTGQAPNESSLKSIVQIMGEMVKVYNGANAAAPIPAPQPQPPRPAQPAIAPPSYPTDEQPEALLPTE